MGLSSAQAKGRIKNVVERISEGEQNNDWSNTW